MNNHPTVTSFILIFLLGFVIQVNAQKAELNNSYQFKDGIYLSFQEFVEDTPSLKLSAVKMEELEGSDYYFKIYQITITNDSSFLRKGIWGLCINGIPYLNDDYTTDVEQTQVMEKRKFIKGFSRIQTIGSISFFAATNAIPVPGNAGMMFGLTGALIASTKKSNYGPGKFNMKILSLKSGEIREFTSENLLEFIKDDAELTSQLKAAKKPKEQMYAILKKYNEAHPFYIE